MLDERSQELVDQIGRVLSEGIYTVRSASVPSSTTEVIRTLSRDQIAVQHHIVDRLFILLEHLPHERQALPILLKSPSVPWVLAKVDVREHGKPEVILSLG